MRTPAPMPNIQHPPQHLLPVSGFWFLVSGVWCLVSGVWCLVSGVWCLAASPDRKVALSQASTFCAGYLAATWLERSYVQWAHSRRLGKNAVCRVPCAVCRVPCAVCRAGMARFCRGQAGHGGNLDVERMRWTWRFFCRMGACLREAVQPFALGGAWAVQVGRRKRRPRARPYALPECAARLADGRLRTCKPCTARLHLVRAAAASRLGQTGPAGCTLGSSHGCLRHWADQIWPDQP